MVLSEFMFVLYFLYVTNANQGPTSWESMGMPAIVADGSYERQDYLFAKPTVLCSDIRVCPHFPPLLAGFVNPVEQRRLLDAKIFGYPPYRGVPTLDRSDCVFFEFVV
jgi:hypothetical protein